MAYTTIDKSTDYFNTKLYAGNGSTQTISGVGFQPDMTWGKARTTTTNHVIQSTAQGLSTAIFPNLTNAESTGLSNAITAFNADGFALGSWSPLNASGQNFVSWNWKAGTTSGIATNGATVTTPSSYSFNQTSGCSILKYTGTGNTNNKLAHGLGAKPDFIMFKKTSGDINWGIYHQSLTADYRLLFTTGAQSDDDSFMQDSEPDSVNINLGYGGLNNASGATYIAYCFAEKQGFSKFGSYVGNGNIDSPFIYTGHKPAFVMVKKSSGTGRWSILNNKSNPSNVTYLMLSPNENSADYTAAAWNTDFLSNGFKIRSTEGEYNADGQTYIYMAFAESPLVGSNNVPATAK